MTKTFTYTVAGKEFTDTQAFGTAWEQAKQFAKETGSEIWRTVEQGNKTRTEFFATGKVFLNEQCYTPEKAFH